MDLAVRTAQHRPVGGLGTRYPKEQALPSASDLTEATATLLLDTTKLCPRRPEEHRG